MLALSKIFYMTGVAGMVYRERNTWSTLIASVVGLIAYAVIIVQRAGGGPLEAVDWFPVMLWTIGGAVAGSIVLSIVWGIVAGLRDGESGSHSDERDQLISIMGERVGHAFLVLGALGGIILCALGADVFWIANTLFLGFALSAILGGVASVIAYRRGLV